MCMQCILIKSIPTLFSHSFQKHPNMPPFISSSSPFFSLSNSLDLISTAHSNLGCLGLGQGTVAAASSRHVQKSVFHTTPPHPLALPFFLSHLPQCPRALGELIQMSYLGPSTQRSVIISTMTIYESLH